MKLYSTILLILLAGCTKKYSKTVKCDNVSFKDFEIERIRTDRDDTTITLKDGRMIVLSPASKCVITYSAIKE